ncbi:hypothetical protein GCM10007916_24990 [Psychromonas marina]|uniref:NAD(P)-binding domain-containing protein n=1 Tax=Psychromonas marina TaxID=88364 RepID=A0ABQ6E2K5_9GAMM|nr:DUF2867 domain-containing protein [Psychromonas marina]GLS91430.1 hypothetical protein GCM10007916_24990 [Psychromonas marina]
MINNVLVVGASGYVGSQLVPLLAQKGYHVTATGRDSKILHKRAWSKLPNINIVQLNLSDNPDLTSMLTDIDVVYFLVHGMSHGHDFVNVELDIAKNFTAYLKTSQVKQLIYLGSLQPQQGHSAHFSARKKTGEILRESHVIVTELRAGIIVGPGSAAFEVMRDFVYHLPLLITPKWMTSNNSPIALENLLYYLLKLLTLTPEQHKIMDVAGPELITYQKQMHIIARLAGKKVRIIPLAILTPKLASYWFKIITSVPTNIAKALVGGLQYDLTADGKQLQALIPQTLLSYEQAVSKTLKQEIDVIDTETWGFDPDALSRWRPGYGYYPKQAGYTLKTTISAASLWQQIQLIGTEQGYFFANYLWRIREWMDYVVGGDALQRFRQHPQKLALGDRIDSWKVIGLKEEQFLSLLLGMKAPGLGRLEFNIEDKGDYRLLDIRAWWHPAGLSGLLYWYAMMPAHLFIFKGMAKAIDKKCKQ